MIYYYKVSDLNDQMLGCVTSHSLRHYNEGVNRILTCKEDLGQYIYFNDAYYRIPWLHRESDKVNYNFPQLQMEIITQEEYEKYMKEYEKAKSDEK